MDNWVLGNAQQPPTQRRRTDNNTSLDKIVRLLAKLTLKHALEIRELQAAAFYTLKVPAGCSYYAAGKSAGEEFNGQAKQMRDDKRPEGDLVKLGTPHWHVWGAIIREACTQAAGSDQEILRKHSAEVTSIDMLGSMVYICKFKRAFNSDVKKLHIAVHPQVEPVAVALMNTILKTDAARLYRGEAPRGAMEKDLQNLLDELQAAQ